MPDPPERHPPCHAHASLAALAAVLLLATVGTGQPTPSWSSPRSRTTPPTSPRRSARRRPSPARCTLGHWLVNRQGGGFGGISRSCTSGGTSEHKEGRAFDWRLDATRKADRQRAAAFLALVKETDKAGNTDARARRMGIMYVIWNDHMYAAWDGFERETT